MQKTRPGGKTAVRVYSHFIRSGRGRPDVISDFFFVPDPQFDTLRDAAIKYQYYGIANRSEGSISLTSKGRFVVASYPYLLYQIRYCLSSKKTAECNVFFGGPNRFFRRFLPLWPS
jgi:hypothetical protein